MTKGAAWHLSPDLQWGMAIHRKTTPEKFDWAISILQIFYEIHLILYISMYTYQKFYIHRNIKAMRKRRVNTDF